MLSSIPKKKGLYLPSLKKLRLSDRLPWYNLVPIGIFPSLKRVLI